MRKPKDGSRIEISGHEYTLKYERGLKSDDGSPLWGHYRVGAGEIVVETDQPERAKQNTILHEIIHGVLEHAGIEQREQLAIAISYGLESVRINGKPLLR